MPTEDPLSIVIHSSLGSHVEFSDFTVFSFTFTQYFAEFSAFAHDLVIS